VLGSVETSKVTSGGGDGDAGDKRGSRDNDAGAKKTGEV